MKTDEEKTITIIETEEQLIKHVLSLPPSSNLSPMERMSVVRVKEKKNE